MKALSVLAGVVLTVVLYFGLLYLLFLYGNGPSTKSPSNEPSTQSYSEPSTQSDSNEPSIPDLEFSGEFSGMYIGIVTVIPVLIFLGSLLTGFLIEPSLEKSWLAFLFYSPGMFFVGILIFMSFTCLWEPHIDIWLLKMYGGIIVAWLFSSFLGVALGYFIRERIARWWYSD